MVGSKQAVKRCLGFEGNEAGFWTTTLLKYEKTQIRGQMMHNNTHNLIITYLPSEYSKI